ncbi:MAG: toxin-antitoxin system YwqK family antitoxin [Chlamydiia bacterium]|nr:toxin-antitoxin system YwqK family antitoxin [Chlamydiia bacterium]
MKYAPHCLLGILAAVLSGCGACNDCENVVTEAYIHKYGVPVTKNDWKAKGSCGVVVTKLKDGVTRSQTFDRDILDGVTTYTFPHTDTLAKKELYRQNELISETEMFASGNPKREVLYQRNGQQTVKTWYEGGTPRSVEHVCDENILAGQYYNPSNEIESEVRDLQGTRIVRDAYGQLVSEDEILNGQLAKSTTFHTNGTPKAITPYQDNKAHGLRRTFLASGEPETIEHWNHGEQTGITVFYSNGEKMSEVEFVSGERHGVERKFRNGSKVVEEIAWNHDKRHGPTRLLLETGTRTDWYHDGKLVSKFAYDELNKRGHR